MSDVIFFVTGFTVNTKMNGSEKSWEGITSVVMVTNFDVDDVFVLGRTLEDDLVVTIHGKDHDLVIGEMTLKGSEFGETTRSFGYTCVTMECLGLSPLNRSASTQTDVLRVTTSEITVGFHGHDGTCATEFIVVLDLDNTLFGIQ